LYFILNFSNRLLVNSKRNHEEYVQDKFTRRKERRMLRRTRHLILGILVLSPAGAFGQEQTVKLATALNSAAVISTGSFEAYAASLSQRRRAAVINPVSLRIGAALGDNSGLLLGADIGVPSISIGAGWSGRIDLDIFGFGDDDTDVALTLNQISSSDGQVYFGFGFGIVTAGDGGFGIKLLIGTALTERVDGEFDIIIGDDVVPAIVFRIHM
jgi:hypothetical protein